MKPLASDRVKDFSDRLLIGRGHDFVVNPDPAETDTVGHSAPLSYGAAIT